MENKFKIEALAVENKNAKFIVPGKKNNFDGFLYDHVMFDTGCGSVLIPFPSASLEDFRKKYSECIWHISYSGGTGALHAPVLKVKGLLEEPRFKVSLDCTNHEFSVDFLRFYLSLDDAKNVLQNCFQELGDKEAKKLKEYISNIDKIKQILPSLKIGQPRNMVLFGQKFFSKKILLQVPNFEILLGIGDKPNWDDIQALLLDVSKSYQLDEIMKSFPEFNDLQDEDHDEDFLDCFEIKYSNLMNEER